MDAKKNNFEEILPEVVVGIFVVAVVFVVDFFEDRF